VDSPSECFPFESFLPSFSSLPPNNILKTTELLKHNLPSAKLLEIRKKRLTKGTNAYQIKNHVAHLLGVISYKVQFEN